MTPASARKYRTWTVAAAILLTAVAAAAAAKLFEKAHGAQAKGKAFDKTLYDRAKQFYLEALYRIIFIGAENSVGFHNPTEAGRILGDSVAFSIKAEGLLRQALAKSGITADEPMSLEHSKYLNSRGSKKLNFRPEREIKDPYDTQSRMLPRAAKGI